MEWNTMESAPRDGSYIVVVGFDDDKLKAMVTRWIREEREEWVQTDSKTMKKRLVVDQYFEEWPYWAEKWAPLPYMG